jgi:hypothetical protein
VGSNPAYSSSPAGLPSGLLSARVFRAAAKCFLRCVSVYKKNAAITTPPPRWWGEENTSDSRKFLLSSANSYRIPVGETTLTYHQFCVQEERCGKLKVIDCWCIGGHTILALDPPPPLMHYSHVRIDGVTYETEIIYDAPRAIAIPVEIDAYGKEAEVF